MTDGYDGRDDPERATGGAGDGPTGPGGPDRRPGRATTVLGGGLALVLLATVGATAGWLLADPADAPRVPPVAASTDRPVPTTPAAPPSTVRPTAGRTTPPATPADTPRGLTVPALVGTDFATAREELRDRKLGWRLVFGTGSGRTVQRTEPAAGTPVSRGTTVRVHVAGPAPAVVVPSLVGEDCDDAADDLGEAGLYPRYRTGRNGTVTSQEPAGGGTAYWNDQVALSCGDEAPTPTGAPATP